MMLKIGIDVDGVLANFAKSFRVEFENYYDIKIPDNFYCNPDYDPKRWHLCDTYKGFPLEIENEFIGKILSGIPNFWRDYIIPLNDFWKAKDCLRELVEIDDNFCKVYFITKRFGNPTLWDTTLQTKQWLARYLEVDYDALNVIVTKHKDKMCDMLGINKIIDDKVKNLLNISNEVDKYLCMKVYNADDRDYKNITLTTLPEFVDNIYQACYPISPCSFDSSLDYEVDYEYKDHDMEYRYEKGINGFE